MILISWLQVEEARAAAKAAEEAKKVAEAEAARLVAVAAEEAKKGAEAAAKAMRETQLRQTVEVVTVKESSSSPVVIEEIPSEPAVSDVLEPPTFVTNLSDSVIQEGK